MKKLFKIYFLVSNQIFFASCATTEDPAKSYFIQKQGKFKADWTFYEQADGDRLACMKESSVKDLYLILRSCQDLENSMEAK